jgi:hypothetical protein
VRASLLRCSVCPAKPDVVTLSSSSTEEALELLFLSPPRDPVSHFSEPSCSSGSDQLEDWPKVNDTTVSVYVALTADVSNSCTSTVNAPRDERKSCADSSSTRHSRSRATSSQRPHHQKVAAIGAP